MRYSPNPNHYEAARPAGKEYDLDILKRIRTFVALGADVFEKVRILPSLIFSVLFSLLLSPSFPLSPSLSLFR